MKTVYKYGIEIKYHFSVSMPAGAQVLTIQVQHGKPFIWALVDTEAQLAERHFRVAGTGHPIEDENPLYVGTYQLHGGDLVFHLFEVGGGK